MFTAEYIPTQTAAQLSSSQKRTVKLYAGNVFVVNIVMVGIYFEKVANNIGSTEVNTTAAREHVGKIERGIFVIKERAQCIVLTLPFKSHTSKFESI